MEIGQLLNVIGFLIAATQLSFWWSNGPQNISLQISPDGPPPCLIGGFAKQGERIVVDILSIGSETRQKLQDAQEKTFGSHATVRNFFRMTESDDTESSCNQKVTLNTVQKVVNICRSRGKTLTDGVESLRKMTMHYARYNWLRKKANPVGWLCAQKRPIDGMYKVMQRYKNNESLPDYLLIGDDDTWFNMQQMETNLPKMYPLDDPYAIAGCMIRSRVYEHNFTIPYGGWGMIFNRKALQNWIRPLHCDSSTNETIMDEFTKLACWRLSRNQVGEKPLFRDGMSVVELMHTYVTDQPYQNVDDWNDVGYCMHSDWALGYFTNFYHLSVPGKEREDVLEERLVGFNDSMIYAGRATPTTKARLRECLNNGVCNKQSNICHYVTEERMYELHSNG